ncbi:MAG: DNA methyltransferase, partial [Bryobacteraceae bacterium]
NVELRPTDSLKPYPHNPRKNDAAVAAVAESIKRFGFRQPIVVDADGVIVVGHTRWKAAKALKIETVPVHVADDLTPAQARAYRIADNKTNELAEWDMDLLPIELAEIAVEDLPALGFTDEELDAFMGGGGEGGQSDPDDIPDAPAPVTQPGDLWILGDHRLLCGDSTKAADVERVMGAERAALMNTDPPYGVSYSNAERPNPGVAKPRVANDVLRDERLQEFLESAFRVAVSQALTPNAAWYLWHAHLTQGFFAAAAAAAANVVLHRQIIWVKNNLLLGRGQYHWKHEPCFMGWVEGHQPPDYGLGSGERTQTTVWEIHGVSNSERKEMNHATPKPVELFRIPIVKHTRKGAVVYEPFAGSGPQFIASEELHRRCFGLEISPAYCDIIVTRWEKFSGRKAERKPA